MNVIMNRDQSRRFVNNKYFAFGKPWFSPFWLIFLICYMDHWSDPGSMSAFVMI
jgi:hypothetical protein